MRPETRVRLGGHDYVIADAMLTLRTSDLPTWLARGTAITSVSSGEIYRVVEFVENGEGITEITLARSA